MMKGFNLPPPAVSASTLRHSRLFARGPGDAELNAGGTGSPGTARNGPGTPDRGTQSKLSSGAPGECP